MIIEHNLESITLGWSWGLLGAILKPFRRVLGSPGAVWEALGVVLGAFGAVFGCVRESGGVLGYLGMLLDFFGKSWGGLGRS